MDRSPHPQLVAELNGLHVGLVDFGPEDALRISDVLAKVGGITRVVRAFDQLSSPPLTRFDIFLVNIDEAQSSIRDGLLKVPQPWLLAGSATAIIPNAVLRSRAEEVMFAPYGDDEILCRLSRLRNRRSSDSTEQPPSHQPVILIADDDPSMRNLLEAVLAPYRVECVIATNGLEALDAVRELLPDLVLLDIRMPGMDGIQVLQAIRNDAATSATKVILLTASRDLHHLHTGAELKADTYVCKPIDHMMLMSRVRSLLPRIRETARERGFPLRRRA